MRKTLMSAMALTSMVALSACGGGANEAPAETGETAEAPAEEAPAEEEAVAVNFADLTGDAAAGANVFVKCQTCHILEEGQNRVGPHLYGVVGRTAGSVEGFNYSDANAGSGVTWTEEVLYEYLENPQGFMPGTRMAFPGIEDPQERADLIAYLAANGEV